MMIRKCFILTFFVLLNLAAYTQVANNTAVIKSRKSTAAKSENFISQNFDNGLGAWTVLDSNKDGYTWEIVANYRQNNSLNGSPFAFVNSDSAGEVLMDEFLMSPKVNVSNAKNLYLSFEYFFNAYSGGTDEYADVDVWDGSQWVNVFRKTEDSGDAGYWLEPAKALINVSAYKNDSFQVRFHYYNASDDFYWAVDNVKLFEKDSFDVALVNVSTFPNNELASNIGPVRFKLAFENVGLNELDTVFYGVRVFSSSGSLVFKSNDTLKSPLSVGQVQETELKTAWMPRDSGYYTVEAYVKCLGEQDSTNNVLKAGFYVFSPLLYDNYVYTFVGQDNGTGNSNFVVGLSPKDGSLQKNFSYSRVLLTEGDFVQEADSAYLLALGNDTIIYLIQPGHIYPLGKVKLSTTTEQLPLALTYDSYNKQVYLLFFDRDKDSNVVYSLDLATLEARQMFSVIGPNALASFAADTLGRLWALDIACDSLYQLDKSTGRARAVGKLPIDVNYLPGLGFERNSNRFYALLYDNVQGNTVFGLIDTTNASLHTIQKIPGMYTICAVNSDTEPQITGLSYDMDITVYPNPTQNFIFVRKGKGKVLELSDLQGRILFQTIVNSDFYRISLGNYVPGIYIVRLYSEDLNVSFKILKIK